jgi:hypothetical protein
MRKEYYCLVAGLSDLFIDASKTGSPLIDFKTYLKEELTQDDYFLIESYFWRFDNQNLLLLLEKKEKDFNKLGNLTKEDFDTIFSLIKEETLSSFSKWIPSYIGRIIISFRNNDTLIPNKSLENQITELYYKSFENLDNSFIKDWYSFEKDFNNILTAFNCRKYGLEIEAQLIGKNELTEKLIKSSAKDFGISDEFPKIDQIFRILEGTNLIEREKKIDLIKWELLDERTFFYYFTIEKIFAYVLKLDIIERWIGLNKETGQELFNRLINDLETSQKFPEEFSKK